MLLEVFHDNVVPRPNLIVLSKPANKIPKLSFLRKIEQNEILDVYYSPPCNSNRKKLWHFENPIGVLYSPIFDDFI